MPVPHNRHTYSHINLLLKFDFNLERPKGTPEWVQSWALAGKDTLAF